MRKRRERDAGLRLDHILVSPTLADRIHDAGGDRTARGREDASDHAPVWVILRDSSKPRGSPTRNAKAKAASAASAASSKL
jgi:exodeoxyribonuclease-3